MGAAKAASAARRRIFFICLGSFGIGDESRFVARKTVRERKNLRDHS